MGLIPGLLAMTLYYVGLGSTPASTATFVELLFPVAAVILNTFILQTPLTIMQLVAAMLLLFSVTMISWSSGRR